jgi:hypothetical protein
MTRFDYTKQLIIVWIVTPEGDKQSVCAIDGRRYPNSDAVGAVLHEVVAEMNARRLPGELEYLPVTPTTPPSGLPSWEEYRRALQSAT